MDRNCNCCYQHDYDDDDDDDKNLYMFICASMLHGVQTQNAIKGIGPTHVMTNQQ